MLRLLQCSGTSLGGGVDWWRKASLYRERYSISKRQHNKLLLKVLPLQLSHLEQMLRAIVDLCDKKSEHERAKNAGCKKHYREAFYPKVAGFFDRQEDVE